MILELFLTLRDNKFKSHKVDLVGSEAEVPHPRPCGRHRLHDEEREEAFRGGACKRVQHLLGTLHMVHIQVLTYNHSFINLLLSHLTSSELVHIH